MRGEGGRVGMGIRRISARIKRGVLRGGKGIWEGMILVH